MMQAPSTFHDSAIGTSFGTRTENALSTASHSSFTSSAADDGHHSNHDPREPEEVALGKPFKCPICDMEVSGVRNLTDWK